MILINYRSGYENEKNYKRFIGNIFCNDWDIIIQNELVLGSCYNCWWYYIFPIQSDGGETPDINWIMVNENMQFIEAVNLYIEMKEYLNNCKSNGFIKSFDFPWIWYYKTTFFITEKDLQLPTDEKDGFIKKCRMNNVHIVKRPKEFEFIDVFDSTKYILDYYTYLGSADDAATYADYTLKKIDSKVKTDKVKLSDKILNGILHSYCKKEYFNDISLNQINIKIQLDDVRMYFLTVYVDDSTGIIKKFSFDIESASDTHYEFDLQGAESIRQLCIKKQGNRWEDDPLDQLLKRYMNTCGYCLTENLVEDFSTAVFHFE